ncbi:MAG: right-handed parallel beta-helix repeat-containing protein [Acidimicrobiales bacterium]
MRRSLGTLMSATILAGAAVAASVASAGVAVASSRPHAATTLYVADNGRSTNADKSCATAKYNSIVAGVAAASTGSTVTVCGGLYGKSVVVTKSIKLVGEGNPTLSASKQDHGIEVIANNVTVSGFKVEHAIGEGILVQTVSGATISFNTVVDNDLGGPKSSYKECQAQGGVPGDCGEGIHLISVHNSTVLKNTVEGNSGGILLSDEYGPTWGNLIEVNTVKNNVYDCGITIVGHNPNAVSSKGVPQPGNAGVYDNTIKSNTVTGNGTKGEGAGILLAAALPGAASYENRIFGNTVSGNGLSGITIHKHFAGQDLSGDVVSGNNIGTNDLTGDPGTGDSSTTGILLDNGGTKQGITITISHNTVSNDTYGIYDDTGSGLTQTDNKFVNVKTDVKT